MNQKSNCLAAARIALEAIIFDYAEHLDSGNFEAVADLFRDGQMLDSNGTLLASGRNDMLNFLKKTVRLYSKTNTPLSQHLVSNLRFDINLDRQTASCRSTFTVLQKTNALPLQAIITGSYLDKFRCSDQGWHLIERKMQPRQVGDLSQHLLQFFSLKQSQGD